MVPSISSTASWQTAWPRRLYPEETGRPWMPRDTCCSWFRDLHSIHSVIRRSLAFFLFSSVYKPRSFLTCEPPHSSTVFQPCWATHLVPLVDQPPWSRQFMQGSAADAGDG